MMMVEKEETIIIRRRKVSPSSSSPTIIKRTARFLTPCLSSSDDDAFDLLPLSALKSSSEEEDPNLLPKNILLRGGGGGWVNNPMKKKWGEWVRRMQEVHEPTWRQAGIYHAIITSTYSVPPDINLVIGLSQRWCPLTNTFVFPFAEATLTLEDVALLSGFSLFGVSVHHTTTGGEAVGGGRPCSGPPLDCDVEIVRELEKAREDLNKSRSKKATVNSWMRVFMGSGSKAEHVAFLVLWLSRHVFRFAHDVVGKHLHALACHLARGTRVALAPSVLASLYRDLTLLKGALFTKKNKDMVVKVWSPMHLVQIWGWERFPTLSPQPNPRIEDEPRMAKWNGVTARRNNLEKGSELANVRSAIDSASESFVWRPYGDDERERGWQLRNIYPDKEKWVSVGPGMREDFKSFAKIVRVSELVGINCIQPYFPHRVSRQFGLDQEIPGQVARFDKSPDIAWKNYNRAIRDEKLYIPAWSFRSGVTSRYLEWWKQLLIVQKKEKNDAAKVKAQKRKSITDLLKETSIATSSRTKKKKAAVEDFAARNKKLKAEKLVTNGKKAAKPKKSWNIKRKGKQGLEKSDLDKIPDDCIPSSGAELEKETGNKKQRLEQTDANKSPDNLRLSSCSESHEELGSNKQNFVVIDDNKITESHEELGSHKQTFVVIDDNKITDNCKCPSNAESLGGMENDNHILGRIDENKIPCMEMNEVSANSRHDEAEINVPSNHVESQEPLSSPLACNDDDVRSESRMEPTKVQENPTQTLNEFGKEIICGNDVNMEPLLEPAKVCENTTKRDEVVADVADEGKERIVGNSVDKDRSEANANLYTLEMLRTMPLEARISRLEILVARLKDERMGLKSVKK